MRRLSGPPFDGRADSGLLKAEPGCRGEGGGSGLLKIDPLVGGVACCEDGRNWALESKEVEATAVIGSANSDPRSRPETAGEPFAARADSGVVKTEPGCLGEGGDSGLLKIDPLVGGVACCENGRN